MRKIYSLNSLVFLLSFSCLTIISGVAKALPTLCTPVHTNGCSWDYFTNVTFATINNSTSCSGLTSGSSVFLTPNPVLMPGSTYTLTVSTYGLGSGDNAYGWIDYNQDGTLATTEAVLTGISAGTGSANTYSVGVTIPLSATPGATYLRLRCNYLGSTGSAGCDVYTWGETHDYQVTIGTLCSVTATASNSGPACPGNSVSLTGVTSGSTYSWAGPAGFSSLVLNPVLPVAVAGVYTLSATNGTCTTTATTTVSLLAAPPAPIITPSVSTMCNGSIQTLTATLPPASVTLFPAQGWESGVPTSPGTPVSGWSTNATSTAYITQATAGTSPTASPHSGSYFADFHSWSYSGISAALISPAFSMTGITGGQITFWVYRDYASFYTGTGYANEGWGVYMNTTGSMTGATSLGFVPRTADQPITGSVTGASTTTSSGWQQYTVNIPASFSGATNYVLFQGVSQYGNNCYLDDISATGLQPLAPPIWTPITNLFSDPAGTTAYVAGTPALNVYVHPTTVTSSTVVNYVGTITNGTCTSSDTAVVTINTPPTAVVATASSITLCVGSTLTLTGSATGATSYSWSGPGGYTAAVLNPAGFTVTAASGGVYTLTATNSCGNITATTASVTVSAGPSGVTATPSATTLCSGDILTLTGTATGGVSYSWSGPGGYSAAVMNPPSFAVTTASAGIYTFTATNTCGSISSTTSSITVNTVPTGVSATASSTAICLGNTLTLTGTATSPITTTYAWSGPGGYSAAVLNPAGFATTASSGGIYSLTATNACGSSNATTASVTINTVPTAVTASISATPLCSGDALTLTGTATSPIAMTYSWSGPGSYSAAVLNPPVIATSTASAGIYTLTATNTCGSTTATTASLVINTVPTAVTATAAPTTLCSGDALTLTGAATSPITMTYGWSGPGGYTSTSLNPSAITTSTSSAGVYTLTATNVCGSTTATTASVTVNTVPTAVTATPSASALCSGSVLTLTGTATSPITTTYSWVGPDAFTSTDLNPSGITTSTLSAGVYTLTATNICGSTSAVTPAVVINTIPSAVTATAAPTTLCAGSPLTLTGTSTSTISTTYSWSGPGGYSSTNLNPAAITTTTLSSGIYTLTATNGCGSTTATTASVTVNAAPTAVTATPSATTLCSGATLTLTGTATSPISTTYSWSGPGGFSSTNLNPAGIITTTSSAGVYTLTATNSCGSTSATTASIIIRTIPTGVTATASPTTLCSGSTLTLTGTATSPITTTYSWTGPNTYSSAVLNPTGIITTTLSAGVYTLTATNICGSATATTASVTVNRTPTLVTATASPLSVCSGATLTLTGTATSPITTTYSWSGPNGYSSTNLNPAGITTSSLSAGIYTLTATNTCGNTTATTSSVTVISAPTSVSASTVASSLCAGASLSLIGTASGATVYNWSGPGGYSSTLLNPPAFTAGTAASGTYTLTAGNSCFTVTATASIIIAPLPPMASITGNTTVCIGTTTNLADSVAGGVWTTSVPSVATINAVGTVFGLSVGSTTISYAYTNTCGTALATSTINVIPVPVATPVAGAAMICQGSSSLYTNTLVGGTWSISDPTVATINASGMVVGVGTGAATVSYTVNNGCGSPVTDTLPISIIITPDAGNIYGAVRVCPGDTIRLYNHTTGGTWHLSNTSASISLTSGLVTGSTYGLDTAYYVVSNMCGADTARYTFYVYTPVQCAAMGVSTITANEVNCTIYPNPNAGSFALTGTWLEGDDEATIEIIDLLGQVVYKKAINITNSKIDEQVQIGGNIASGMYMLRINSTNAHKAIRFSISQ